MDISPPAAVVTLDIDLTFKGANREPQFALVNSSPPGSLVTVDEAGTIDLSNLDAAAKIRFRIVSIDSKYKVKWKGDARNSLLLSEQPFGRKRPWPESKQVTDVVISKDTMIICYTNKFGEEFSRYGIKYKVDGDNEYYDPAIKNVARPSSIPRAVCKL